MSLVLPGVINLGAIALYTHLLSPRDFGAYSIVVAASALGYGVGFLWIPLSVLRFWSGPDAGRPVLIASLARGAAWSVGGTLAIALTLALLLPAIRLHVAAGLILTWSQSWYEINVAVLRASERPARFAALSLTRSLLGVSTAIALVLAGFGFAGLVFGLSIGFAAAPVIVGSQRLFGSAAPPNGELLGELLRYGAPLAAAAVAGLVMLHSDRFLIGALASLHDAGLYSTGQAFAQQSVMLLLSSVGMAFYPWIVDSMDRHGRVAASQALGRGGIHLIAVALPLVVGALMLRVPIATLLVAPGYQEGAAKVIGWIALAAVLGGIREFHVARVFHLVKTPGAYLAPLAIAAGAGIALNLLLIPPLGMTGALTAAVTAQAIALLATARRAHRLLPLTLPSGEVLRVMVATAALYLLLSMIPQVHGTRSLGVAVLVASIAYLSILYVLDFQRIRSRRVAC